MNLDERLIKIVPSERHDGFCLWDCKYIKHTVMNV